MKVLVPLANGAEEMEAVIVIDTLRRAGWQVVAASIHDEVVNCSRGVRLVADKLWSDVKPDAFDIIVLPGGAEGTRALMSHHGVIETIRAHAGAGRTVAAICAAPLVLQSAGLLAGRRATCHPAVRNELRDPELVDADVVVDGCIVTGRGPGTALEFALALIGLCGGPELRSRVAYGMAVPQNDGRCNR